MKIFALKRSEGQYNGVMKFITFYFTHLILSSQIKIFIIVKTTMCNFQTLKPLLTHDFQIC